MNDLLNKTLVKIYNTESREELNKIKVRVLSVAQINDNEEVKIGWTEEEVSTILWAISKRRFNHLENKI